MEINYVGEHLWAGKLGNIFVIIAFISAIISSASFFFSVQKNSEEWKRFGRKIFRIHSIAVAGIVLTLFWMLLYHYFEYHFVWQHSSKELETKFVFASFWEGQEGSFLLWTFWHAVLGNILIRTSKDWEAPVMATVSAVQAFLGVMVLGVYIFNYKIGSNPFTDLLREYPEFKNLPFIQNPNYLEKLDGRGLNPLLQNYWMTIHPPTLFLGFAATVVPFAYAIAGLWTKRFNEWQKPALPWTFFGVMILGTGILMGGAWAYEALSFGGFWAWDPVENASLVPWITLVGGAHVMLINKNKGTSLFTGFFLITLTFILILYSTFLTRSGILGNTSVHAFTENGMLWQLVVFLAAFTLLTIYLISKNANKFPKQAEEDSVWSREFWMFIGALLLLISAFQITFTTSIPVINKIFGSNLAPPGAGKIIEHYNKWQIPFISIITFLIAIGQFLKYKKTALKDFRKKITLPVFFAITVSLFLSWHFGWLSKAGVFYSVLLFTTLFAVSANLHYFVRILKGKFNQAGASIAHVGFGLIILGALISNSLSEKISMNKKGNVEILDRSLSNEENILLQKFDTVPMGDYFVTYKGRRNEGIYIYYDVEYLKKSGEKLVPQFTLSPRVQLNERMGNAAEPDTRHYLTKDIYTHVTYAEIESEKVVNGWGEQHNYSISIGDTIAVHNGIIVLEGINTNINKPKYKLDSTEIAVGAQLKIFDFYKNERQAMPVYAIKNNVPVVIEDTVHDLGIKTALWKINPETKKFDISIAEKKSEMKEFIVMKAVIFPYINILWMGCIVMIIGTILAIRQRIIK